MLKKLIMLSSFLIIFPITSHAEDIKEIEIVDIKNVKIESNNKEIIQDGVGALAGSIIGYGIAHYTTNYGQFGKSIIAAGSGITGAYVAQKYGTYNTTDGLKIDYKIDSKLENLTMTAPNGANYHTGKAILIIDNNGNKTIHQKTIEQHTS